MTTIISAMPDPEEPEGGAGLELSGQAVHASRRERLPRMRNSKTFSFRVADCRGYVTVGEYDDGRPGEIFMRLAKRSTTVAGILDALGIAVSMGLQRGISLRDYVEAYLGLRFEPAGITDDPEIRFASSVVDYLFRRLAMEYLSAEDRAELGILTVAERLRPVPDSPLDTLPAPPTEGDWSQLRPDPNAPYCYVCGVVMQRAGACFVCTGCGTTSGCS
jgi:ribonucleoside-diphosphate reductase alpha chain